MPSVGDTNEPELALFHRHLRVTDGGRHPPARMRVIMSHQGCPACPSGTVGRYQHRRIDLEPDRGIAGHVFCRQDF